jgi:hypothetical protein
MTLQTPPSLTEWVTDSSVSNHFTSDPDNISLSRLPNHVILSSIIVHNRSVLLVTSVGDTVLPGLFYLNNVIIIPDIIKNLLFIRQFTTNIWCSIEFDHFDLSVKDFTTTDVIIKYNSSRLLYIICLAATCPLQTSTQYILTFLQWSFGFGCRTQ